MDQPRCTDVNEKIIVVQRLKQKGMQCDSKVGYTKIVALGRIFKMQTRNSYDKFHHLVAKLGTNTSDSTFKLISARNMF